ncbi:MAG: response regulator transcription factor [Lachnospiraceae bacterium]|nr:response regulator transcription factor [Lachnospiraceae bacterium]
MGKNILFVEDDEFIQNSVLQLLCQEGYQVKPCSCLENAREAFLQQVPDLVILDVLLPDGSGFDFCCEIRESSKVPVLFLTCCDEDEDTIRGLECGGDDYVAKPFRAGVLLSRIMALLRRAQIGQDVNLRVGVFQFDHVKGSCHAEGKALALTPMEYRIFYALARNANSLVLREDLLHAVWEMGGEYLDDNTLSVHISRLRAKLGKHSAKLVTVRGEGYLLRCGDEKNGEMQEAGV